MTFGVNIWPLTPRGQHLTFGVKIYPVEVSVWDDAMVAGFQPILLVSSE